MKSFYIFALFVVFTTLLMSCSADDSNDSNSITLRPNKTDDTTIKNDTVKDKDWDTIKIK